MKKLLILTLFSLSFNCLANEVVYCSSHCVQIGPSGDIYYMQTLSAKGISKKEAWSKLKRLCRKNYRAYVTELMSLEGVQSHREIRTSYRRWWYRDEVSNTWMSFKIDYPKEENCSVEDDGYYDGNLDVLG